MTNETTDLCSSDLQLGNVYQSGYSKNPNTFTCGATYQSLLACTLSNGYATCIQSYSDRIATRFPTKVKRVTPNGSSAAAPLAATLTDGTVCSAAAHDQSPHYGGRMSWLHCNGAGDGVLLLPKGVDDSSGPYFDRSGASWTAQYSRNGAAPITTHVASVIYAA